MRQIKLARIVLITIPILVLSTLAENRIRSEASEQVKQEIIAREKASFTAWQKKDRAFYDQYWADDMTEYLPDQPGLLSKHDNMSKFDEFVNAWRLDSVEMINPEVRLYGNVALLTYEENVTGAQTGKPVRYHGKVTMVYVKENGSWRGVHYHESKD